VVFVGIVELPHAEQVAALESAKIRMTSGNVTRELVNDALTPNGLLELLAYVSADFPVKSDQARIDRLQRTLTRAADQINDLAKFGLMPREIRRFRCRLVDRGSSFDIHESNSHVAF
jgi:hypothetical protein